MTAGPELEGAGWPEKPPCWRYRLDNDALRHWVGARDMSLARLALLTGISESALYRWVRQGNTRLGADELMRLCDALEIWPTAIMTRVRED